MIRSSTQIYLLLILFLMSFPSFSYMGPGVGLTAIGCLLALVAGLWYTFFGFIWLPLKRKFFSSKNERSNEECAQVEGDKAIKDNTNNKIEH